MTSATSEQHKLEEQIARERQRIGYELHDGLGQELTGLAFLVRSIAQDIQGKDGRSASALLEVASRLNGAIAGLRELARELARGGDPAAHILKALRELGRRSAAEHGIQVTCESRGVAQLKLSAEDAEHLYRITQEALSNAVRHGRSSRIAISVRNTAGGLKLRIVDNGSGFRMPKLPSRGIGLGAMQHRARSIGGTLTVHSEPGMGTRVEVSCPHRGSL